MLSSDAYKKLPTITLNVQGKDVEFLVDSGATNSVLQKSLFPDQKLSGRIILCRSASGAIVPERFSSPMSCVHSDPNDSEPGKRAKCSFLLSPLCPVNLLGRDLMLRFGVGVIPTATGLKVVRLDITTQDDSLFSQSAHGSQLVFQWAIPQAHAAGLLHEARNLISPFAEFREEHDLHCTCFVSSQRDDMFVEDFFEEEADELECIYLYWHENKCAVAVNLTEKQKVFFRVQHSHAHISLSKSPTDQWRNLGQFVLDCDQLTDWTETVEGNVYTSPSTGAYRKLLSQRVTATRSVFQRKEAETHTHTFLNNSVIVSPSDISPLLSRVPGHLWAAHKYDVGLIKNCQPVVITPRSDFRPKKHQYPLKQEAINGIRPVFNSLLKAGVIVPCPDSPVRTPIFPVKKIRDKGKPVEWRFVQDLKAVNAAVHARAPNVPNPYTILQGIPGGAQYFSVVDLSNAFFSVPVDKDSQFWFAFLFDDEGEPHDCLAELQHTCAPRPDLTDTPVPNSDRVLYVDGSASRCPDTGQGQLDRFRTIGNNPNNVQPYSGSSTLDQM
ncbi:uncharacterized protein LOC117939686 [Etheostoma cragini]|uniref:uncharacterized protein LOC117939686 n=1 Tax=Etheostoma cragini TaxID=417921 RepID=UPI00155DF25A|nr:uncharacterized protein LOC117939686 [Etheostoma cragini]